jgi:hypothetical protein
MTRLRAALLAVLCTATATLTVRTAPAQGTGEADRLIYRDRAKDGKLESVVSELKESAAGVQVVGPDKKVKLTVSPADVVRIEYGALKNVDRDAYAAANQLDAGPDPAKAAAAFADLLLKAGPAADARTKRVLTFRQLMLAVRANDAEIDDAKFAAAAAPLAAKLSAFSRTAAKSWECWPTARAACRLLVELRKPAEAALLAKELGDNADLAPDLRADARLMEVGYQFMAPGRGAAGALVEARKGEATLADRQKEKVAIFAEVLALPEPETVDAKLLPDEAAKAAAAAAKRIRDAVAKVETGVIAKAKDPTARAAGFNALGEVYLRHGLLRDAMWAFLWVDVVYNQDKDEQVKAITRLIQVYKATGEEERERQFRDRLVKNR